MQPSLRHYSVKSSEQVKFPCKVNLKSSKSLQRLPLSTPSLSSAPWQPPSKLRISKSSEITPSNLHIPLNDHNAMKKQDKIKSSVTQAQTTIKILDLTQNRGTKYAHKCTYQSSKIELDEDLRVLWGHQFTRHFFWTPGVHYHTK